VARLAILATGQGWSRQNGQPLWGPSGWLRAGQPPPRLHFPLQPPLFSPQLIVPTQPNLTSPPHHLTTPHLLNAQVASTINLSWLLSAIHHLLRGHHLMLRTVSYCTVPYRSASSLSSNITAIVRCLITLTSDQYSSSQSWTQSFNDSKRVAIATHLLPNR
jgi:hypothetical protein